MRALTRRNPKTAHAGPLTCTAPLPPSVLLSRALLSRRHRFGCRSSIEGTAPLIIGQGLLPVRVPDMLIDLTAHDLRPAG